MTRKTIEDWKALVQEGRIGKYGVLWFGEFPALCPFGYDSCSERCPLFEHTGTGWVRLHCGAGTRIIALEGHQ